MLHSQVCVFFFLAEVFVEEDSDLIQMLLILDQIQESKWLKQVVMAKNIQAAEAPQAVKPVELKG